MTYATEKAKVGRRSLTVLELDLDYCSQSWGVAPCTAAGPAGSQCYNTRKTCQDSANFTKTVKTYRFCQPRADLPKGIDMLPVIVGDPDLTPVKAAIYGLGDRGKINITLQDFPHNDVGYDPYYATRTYTPYSQGTFFGKMIARNTYYIGRVMRILTGFIGDTFSWSDFQSRTYVIDSITGPDKSGKIKVSGSDLLKLADDDKAQCPVISQGKLTGDITAVATTLSVTAGQGVNYGSSGYVRIGEEIIQFASRAVDALNGLTRATWGTVAATHATNDAAQLCKAWSAVNVVNITHELLTTFADVAKTNIPFDAGLDVPTGTNDQWDNSKADWLSSNNITAIISAPTGVKKLLQELAEQNQFGLYVDVVNNKIRLVTNTPPLANAAITTLSEAANILDDSSSITEDTKNQYTQAWIYYGPINYAKSLDENSNYKYLYVYADLTSEGVNLFNISKVKKIKSSWFDSTTSAIVATMAGRIGARLASPPKTIKFSLDAKDADLTIGNIISITSRSHQDAAGASAAFQGLITYIDERVDRYHYEAIQTSFGGLYAFIGPNTLGNYGAESAANKAKYAFICGNSGLFANGDPGHKII